MQHIAKKKLKRIEIERLILESEVEHYKILLERLGAQDPIVQRIARRFNFPQRISNIIL